LLTCLVSTCSGRYFLNTELNIGLNIGLNIKAKGVFVARPGPIQQHLSTAVVLVVIYAGLWLLLSNNQGWGFGAVFIALAVLCALSSRLTLPRVAWRYLPGFLVFFLSRMLLGGIDVARRTVGRKADIQPGWVPHQLSASSAFARLLLSAITGLLPGTLAARIDGDIMQVHTLDTRQDWQRDVTSLESHLARLFPSAEEVS
jgi:multicomponent Na+:H+ antiporter subunit E